MEAVGQEQERLATEYSDAAIDAAKGYGYGKAIGFFSGIFGNIAGKFKKLKSGVYDLSASGGKYVGQSKNFWNRIRQHFSKRGKLFGQKIRDEVFHSMPGSSKLEREVYEQYLIDSYGLQNLQNVRNPMGGRRELYESMIDNVIKKYDLPRI